MSLPAEDELRALGAADGGRTRGGGVGPTGDQRESLAPLRAPTRAGPLSPRPFARSAARPPPAPAAPRTRRRRILRRVPGPRSPSTAAPHRAGSRPVRSREQRADDGDQVRRRGLRGSDAAHANGEVRIAQRHASIQRRLERHRPIERVRDERLCMRTQPRHPRFVHEWQHVLGRLGRRERKS